MKKSLLVLGLLGLTWSGWAQSSIYQTGPYIGFDDSFELYDKNLFGASRYEFEHLKNRPLTYTMRGEADFYHAVSALELDHPNGVGLLTDFMEVYANEPKANDAAHLLGDYFFQKRNYRASIENFSKVNINKVDAEQKGEVLFKTGYAFFQLKDFNNAARYFDQVKSFRSAYLADAFYYSGYIAMESGNTEKAITDFLAADKAPFYATKVPYMISGLYYRQGRYDEVINYATPILEKRKNLDKKEFIHLYLAESYYEKGDFSSAARNYDAAAVGKKNVLNRGQMYKAGEVQYEAGNYMQATNYFKEVALQNDQLGQVSSYFMGHAYLKLNNPTFASNSFAAAYKSDADPNIKQEALYDYAKVNLERGSFQDAVNALDTYLENYPRAVHAREVENLLSDALVNTDNYIRAIEHIEKMSQKSDRIKAAYQKVALYQGISYYRDNRFPLAITYFDKSLSSPVDRNLVAQAHFWKGETHSANQRLPEALRAYEAVLAMNLQANDPYLIRTHYGLGYAYFNLDQYDKAERQFKSYTDKLAGASEKKNYEDALLRLGDSYYVQKKFGNAQATFQQAINQQIDGIDYAYFRSGVIYNFENQNNYAIAALNQIINNFPSSLYWEDAVYQKAQINMEETKYAEARQGFTNLIGARPNSPFLPFAFEGRAIANYSLRDYDNAIEDYKRILDQFPNASNADAALVGLQEALTLQGRSGEFSGYLSNYRKANPGNESLQGIEFEAAKNLFFNQSFQESIRAFETYKRNYPNSGRSAEANYFIGDAHFRLGQKDKALEFFYAVEKSDNTAQKSRAMQRIGEIELEAKNYQKAIPYLQFTSKNARTKMDEYEAFKGLMDAYFQTQRFDSTIHYADRVLALGNITPDASPHALLFKAKSLKSSNQESKAEEVLNKLVNEYKTVQGAEGLYLLALSKHDKGQFGSSNETIFDSSAPFGVYDYWYGRIFILLAENYIKLGETFQAKATLESIIDNSPNEEIRQMSQQLLNTLG
ncbi:tetratricopeptide repeat protein [Pararhodonellum marinum]|uniref:tetratricopeptide repeat protein n=1 Tax=Pararhodonellum marinum TaxID=2755358 RepID=UPI00188F2C0F|nr:tetratricopeptide repeat protein [Pararhodonellum marinum]